MAWNKSNNYKIGYSEYAGNLASGYVGDIPVQSAEVGYFGDTIIKTTFINIYDKPAIPINVVNDPNYQFMGSVLIAQEKKLKNGYVYKMPTWSKSPLSSMNFPTGINISGHLYQPLLMKLCNAGINYDIEILGRVL